MYAWKRDEPGAHVGYLPQDVELFEGSINENIARFDEVDPVAVVEAARLAGEHELILQLPQGYGTLIGASSGGLPGGQRQRIGLARAVDKKPRLIILDEANSNPDDEGERALFLAIRQLMEAGTTLFVITHRTSVLAAVDTLLGLREGTQVMSGPRDQVLAELQKAPKAQQAAAGKALIVPA